MGTPQTPRRRRSPWARYAPYIAVIVVIAIVVVVLATRSNNNDKKHNNVSATEAQNTATDVPVNFQVAKAQGKTDKYTWQDHCDTKSGTVAIPVLLPAPCVPKFTGDNGGATSTGVTADSIKIGYYIAKPDPAVDALTKAAGAYDTPAQVSQTVQDYVQIFSNMYQLNGRKIDLVRIDGTGAQTDEVAARADAKRAADEGLFAVIGGPTQAKSFSEELAADHVMCVGTCIISQPEKYLADNSPYLWNYNPAPEQATIQTVEFIKKQLAGKDAVYAGDPAFQKEKRRFAILSYDTPDGQFKASWDDLEKKMKDAGLDVVGHVSYFLNVNTMQTDARTIATKIKQTGATSIVFTGDPLLPRFFTAEATKQNYFPEWIMSGTVLADTNVFARTFDQRQWAHAFGLLLTPAKVQRQQQDSWNLHRWWFGTDPPSQNSFAISYGDVSTLFAGLQLAGPHLTPETFRDGMYNVQPQTTKASVRGVYTYGHHGFWPTTDPAGLDNAGLLFWDPNATGQDETGATGQGMYRMVNGGERYLPGHWPTTPIKLFDPANTVTVYGANNLPPELTPPTEPVPSNAPAASKT